MSVPDPWGWGYFTICGARFVSREEADMHEECCENCDEELRGDQYDCVEEEDE